MTGRYRKNVGIVVFNTNGKVLMCARADLPDYQWQFPQGGINAGEDIQEAACRELMEETGIASAKPVAMMPQPLRYDYPPNVLKKFSERPGKYVGQEQYWVLFCFKGSNDEINFLTHPEEIEFKAFEWVDISEAPKRIVSFKKEVYKKVADFFKDEIKKHC